MYSLVIEVKEIEKMGKDFLASRQLKDSVEVFPVNGNMAIMLPDDPVYITKQQAMKFFDLIESTPTNKP